MSKKNSVKKTEKDLKLFYLVENLKSSEAVSTKALMEGGYMPFNLDELKNVNKNIYTQLIDENGKYDIRYLVADTLRIDSTTGRNAYLLGQRLDYIIQNKLYKKMGYTSVEEFFKEVIGIAKSTAYNFIKLYRNFTENDAITFGTILFYFYSLLDSEDIDNKDITKALEYVKEKSMTAQQAKIFSKMIKDNNDVDYSIENHRQGLIPTMKKEAPKTVGAVLSSYNEEEKEEMAKEGYRVRTDNDHEMPVTEVLEKEENQQVELKLIKQNKSEERKKENKESLNEAREIPFTILNVHDVSEDGNLILSDASKKAIKTCGFTDFLIIGAPRKEVINEMNTLFQEDSTTLRRLQRMIREELGDDFIAKMLSSVRNNVM